jgi:hypothetical protein
MFRRVFGRIRLNIVNKYQNLSPRIKENGALIIGSSLTTASLFTFLLNVWEVAKNTRDVNDGVKVITDIYETLSFSLANSKAIFSEDTGISSMYIPRIELENKIENIYFNNNLISGEYNIIYGTKGAGKSSLVARVLRDKVGVVLLPVGQGDTIESIIRKLFVSCGVSYSKSIELIDVQRALKKASEKNNRPLTIVFDVDRGGSSQDVFILVKQASKKFALDANVLIVLSEANAVLGFGEDKRQNFVWVDELTEIEAKQYLKRRGIDENSAEVELFLRDIGALPLDLCLFVKALKSGQTAQQYMDKMVSLARADLVAFSLQSILVALKKSPEGVKTEDFKGKEVKGLLLSQPKDVGVAMKKQNAIVYHFDSKEYRMFSKAHKTALKQYEPTSTSKGWW